MEIVFVIIRKLYKNYTIIIIRIISINEVKAGI